MQYQQVAGGIEGENSNRIQISSSQSSRKRGIASVSAIVLLKSKTVVLRQPGIKIEGLPDS